MAKGKYVLPERKQKYDYNPATGEKIYRFTDRSYKKFAKDPAEFLDSLRA